jgi:hypothetical protein
LDFLMPDRARDLQRDQFQEVCVALALEVQKGVGRGAGMVAL